MANEFYEINVYDYFDLNLHSLQDYLSGVADCSDAFQDAVDAASTNHFCRLYIPLAQGQRYRITRTINISAEYFTVFGDGIVGRQNLVNNVTPPQIQNGYIFAAYITPPTPITFDSIFKFTQNTSNSILWIEGLCFAKNPDELTPFNISAIEIDTLYSNRPEKVVLKNCSVYELARFVTLNSNTAPLTAVSCEFIKFINCNMNDGEKSVLANSSVFGINISNNSFEQGASIKGNFCGLITLNYNDIEGQANVVDLGYQTPSAHNVLFDMNYVEFYTNQFLFRKQSADQDGIVVVGNQHSIEVNSANDILVFEGNNRLVYKEENRIVSVITDDDIKRSYSNVNLNPFHLIWNGNPFVSSLINGSSINGESFYINVDPNQILNNRLFVSTFLNPFEYFKFLPNTNGEIITHIGNGSQTVQTPYGLNNYGLILGYNVFSNLILVSNLKYSTSFRYNVSIVVSILLKFKKISTGEEIIPIIQIYDQSISILQTINTEVITYKNNETWFINTGVILGNFNGNLNSDIYLQIGFDSNIQNSSNAEMHIGGVGAYSTEVKDIKFYNINPSPTDLCSILITPFVPFNI